MVKINVVVLVIFFPARLAGLLGRANMLVSSHEVLPSFSFFRASLTITIGLIGVFSPIAIIHIMGDLSIPARRGVYLSGYVKCFSGFELSTYHAMRPAPCRDSTYCTASCQSMFAICIFRAPFQILYTV